MNSIFIEITVLIWIGLSTEECLLAPGPKQSDDLTIQWKRRTILTTEATFPHIRRRLEIIQVTEIDFTPIDSAIDAIQVSQSRT